MAKFNFLQPGENILVKSTGAFTNKDANDVVVIGSLIGVLDAPPVDNDTGVLTTRGVFRLPKSNSVAMAVGDKLYWDAGDGNLNKTAASNTLAGVCVKAAATTDTAVEVWMNSSMAAAS